MKNKSGSIKQRILISAIGTLRDDLAQLKTRLREFIRSQEDEKNDHANEEERVKGFDKNSALSLDEKEEENEDLKNLEYRISLMEEGLLKREKEIENVTKTKEEIDEILKGSSEIKSQEISQDGKNKGTIFVCESNDEARQLATKLKGKFESLGLKCDMSESKNLITITVGMPKEFIGRNPLEMSADDLIVAKNLLENENGKNNEPNNPRPEQRQERNSALSLNDTTLKIPFSGESGLAVVGGWTQRIANERNGSPGRGDSLVR